MIKGERKEYSKTKFVYVRRLLDGQLLDMSEWDWYENICNKNEFQFIGYVGDVQQTVNEPPKFFAPGDTAMHACPLCGKTYKTEKLLKTHREKAHA
ncbi:MAG: hypothetical protein M1383_06200 [Patescibacteria group bacterium]|nr:hypothetical protein [Patescibacteria group bacterium]